MTFAEANEVVIPFGKYRGQTIGKIAETDEGLKYLDWLIMMVRSEHIKKALTVFLKDEGIAAELQDLVEDPMDLSDA